jgi:hypothetical protein
MGYRTNYAHCCSTSREKKLMLALLALVITILLWNSIWALVKLAVFLAVVYAIYIMLRAHI